MNFIRQLLRPSTFVPLSAAGIAGTLVASSLTISSEDNNTSSETTPSFSFKPRPGAPPVLGEPAYTQKQVAMADGRDGRPMWVTYRGGVYDITEFHRAHPGGSLILQAAGGDVAAFWDVWAYHHLAPSVGKYMKELRIGTLKEENDNSESGVDPYEDDPVRDRKLQMVLTERPYCSESQKKEIGSSYLTSTEAFYVRNHAPVPACAFESDEITPSSPLQHEIAFDIVTEEDDTSETLVLTVSELEKKFGTTTITSVLQCAGNRAADDIAATGASGFSGGPFEDIKYGMLGNAQWRGVPLADIVKSLYPDPCAAAVEDGGEDRWHIVFEGADGYCTSTPLIRVLRRENDCLLATHMNGRPLSPDHGYPMRVLLPGVAGARNVKWLEAVRVQEKPVDAPWNAYYYRNAQGNHIQELPLQSLIVKAGCDDDSDIEVSGVAYSGGTGNEIAKVEVSPDGGMTWQTAELKRDEILEDESQKNFGWVRWEAKIARPGSADETATVCCRATDTDGNEQQEISPKQRGYLYNGWHKVQVCGSDA